MSRQFVYMIPPESETRHPTARAGGSCFGFSGVGTIDRTNRDFYHGVVGKKSRLNLQLVCPLFYCHYI